MATAAVLEHMPGVAPGDVTAETYARLNDLWPHRRRLVRAQTTASR